MHHTKGEMMFGKITVDLYEKQKFNGFQGSHFLKFAFGFQISKEATEEEVEKMSPSKNIELHKLIFCATCNKLNTKSQIELHKLECTSD